MKSTHILRLDMLFVLVCFCQLVNAQVNVKYALTPTAIDNDYTPIKIAIESAPDNSTINLTGTFDWTEANAAASLALGNDGVNATADDYSILVPINKNGITFTVPLGLGTDMVPVACNNVTNTTTLEVFCGIQEAIDDAQTVNGHTLVIGSGTYVENITINKELTLTGAGNGSNPATNSVLSVNPCGGIGFSISAANVTIQNMYVTGFQKAVQLFGVSNPTINNMNLVDYCQYGVQISGTNSNISITGSTIQRTTPLAGTVGIRVGSADAVNGMLISNSTITGNNLQGMVVFQASVPVAFNNIIIQNSVISNNLQKGLYFEKLSNATLNGLVMDNNGTDPTYNNNNGVDINLKYGAYSNITIQNCDITNSAVMGTAVDPEVSAVITIKARDDVPSYSTIPASLNNVMIKNNRITGPQNGIRIGEYGKINASPTNVILEGNDLSHVFANKTLISRINADINLDCNWHGTTNIPTIEATFTEAGSGMILLNDLLNTGGDGSGAPGFQPSGNCACPSGFAIVNSTTMVAYCDIQAALAASQPGEEIHIMSGTGVGFFEVEYGQVLVILPGVSFTSSGEICNNGTITVNTGGLFMNAGTYSGQGDFNGAFNNIGGGMVKPGGCGL